MVHGAMVLCSRPVSSGCVATSAAWSWVCRPALCNATPPTLGTFQNTHESRWSKSEVGHFDPWSGNQLQPLFGWPTVASTLSTKPLVLEMSTRSYLSVTAAMVQLASYEHIFYSGRWAAGVSKKMQQGIGPIPQETVQVSFLASVICVCRCSCRFWRIWPWWWKLCWTDPHWTVKIGGLDWSFFDLRLRHHNNSAWIQPIWKQPGHSKHLEREYITHKIVQYTYYSPPPKKTCVPALFSTSRYFSLSMHDCFNASVCARTSCKTRRQASHDEIPCSGSSP